LKREEKNIGYNNLCMKLFVKRAPGGPIFCTQVTSYRSVKETAHHC